VRWRKGDVEIPLFEEALESRKNARAIKSVPIRAAL
jgi:hypothetical protein